MGSSSFVGKCLMWECGSEAMVLRWDAPRNECGVARGNP